MRKFAKFFSALLAVYILIYAALSIFGSYQPTMVGTFGVEQYQWAPLGFYNSNHPAHSKNMGWSSFMCYTFLPLWIVDVYFIHKNPHETT